MPYFYVDMIYEAMCSIRLNAADEAKARRKAIVYLKTNEVAAPKERHLRMCKVTKSKKLITKKKATRNGRAGTIRSRSERPVEGRSSQLQQRRDYHT